MMYDEEPEESSAASGLRNVARQGSNLATRAIGLPGDLFSLVNEYIANPTVKAFGGSEVPYEDTLLGRAIPTTETHRKGVESVTGEYLKPKDRVERFVDDVIEDTALLLVPGGKGTKLTRAVPKSFMTSVGANLSGKAAEDLSGSESVGNATKLGSMFFLSLLSAPKAAEKLSQLYKNAEKNLPADATTSAERLKESVLGLKEKVTKGRPIGNLAPSEKFVIDEIEKIESLIKDGKINVNQAWAQKRSLSENLQKHVFDTVDRGAQTKAKQLAKPLTHFLNESIGQYGKKNPRFYEPFKQAEEGFGVMAKSNFVSNWVDKNITSLPATTGLLHLFGSTTAKAGSAAAVPYYATKIGYRVAKSPVLRKMYTEALGAATRDDAAAFAKILNKMDEKLQQEENNDRFEFVD